jgi:hypothetical protein
MKTRKKDRPSAEPWEVERLHREFPVQSEQDLEHAVEDCKTQAPEAKQKEQLDRCVQRKLSK